MHALARGTLAVTLLSLALASSASAQASYPNVKLAGRLQEQIYYFDNDFYAPVGVGPNSNIFTRRARIEGKVILQAVVDKEGTVDEVTVLSSNNPMFNDAAILAVKQWKY